MINEVNECLTVAAISGVGVVSAHEKGFGFVRDENDVSQFVPPPLMKQFIPGDVVKYTVSFDAKSGKSAVSNMTLIERQDSYWLGEIKNNFHGKPEFKPDDVVHVKLRLPANHGMVPGDVFQVHVRGGSVDASTSVPVTITTNIGPRNKRGFDVDYAVAKWRLPFGWSKEVMDEAEKIELVTPSIHDGVLDMSDLSFVTIDGEGTRDFDDAIYAEQDGQVTHLKVAIADVSRYVKIGSALDAEARRRGTSVYFPSRVIPMLPECLSNGLCSLNPGVLRHAVVCSLTIDADGTVKSRRFDRALIKSFARLTYKQVSAYVENGESLPLEVVACIDAIKAFFDRQLPSRMLRGLLESRDREPKIRFDTENADAPYRVEWTESTIADEMVEECMLAANCAAASHVINGSASHLYRYHQGVDVDKWAETREWLSINGIAAPETPSLAFMRELLLSHKSDVRFPLIEWRVRRSFAPAVYDEHRPAHFTLGFDAYTHFTSPIRRYADLMVHRLLLGEVPSAGADIAKQCTELSRRAQVSSRYPWDRIKRRALHCEVPMPHASRIAKTAKRGVKVIVDAWQTAVFVPGKRLEVDGYIWNNDSETWTSAGGDVLEEGAIAKVKIVDLIDAEAICDLEGALVP